MHHGYTSKPTTKTSIYYCCCIHQHSKKIMQRKPIIVLVVGILIYLFTWPSDGGVSTITDENVGSSELSSRVTTPVLDDRPRLLYFISINASSIEAKYPHSDDEKDVLDAYASVLLNS